MLEIFSKLADSVLQMLDLEKGSSLGSSLHFFIEDSVKIMVLVVVMIYLISLVRAGLDIEKVRDKIQGKGKLFGYAAASLFGAVTPFCSCSSIPLFLGFTSAGIPVGVTLSFLITSPLINEVAVVLLSSILGWKLTLIYIGIGLVAGILGGFLFDKIKAEKYLQPLGLQAQAMSKQNDSGVSHNNLVETKKISFRERNHFARREVKEIFGRIWKWILIGVGAGAAIHGYVPESVIVENLGEGSLWSVPLAVIMGIPLYSNASGMIPVLESLLAKGLPIGTAMAFMMSVVGASFPEFILLKQVLKPALLVRIFLYFLAAFTLSGWILNWAF
jgi:uncharacterized membrane protein YraQ (UPF0718 family)